MLLHGTLVNRVVVVPPYLHVLQVLLVEIAETDRPYKPRTVVVSPIAYLQSVYSCEHAAVALNADSPHSLDLEGEDSDKYDKHRPDRWKSPDDSPGLTSTWWIIGVNNQAVAPKMHKMLAGFD